MKKKLVLILVAAVLMAVVGPARAVPWWNPGDPGSTYQYWDFLSGEVSEDGGGLYEWTASPTEMDNPELAAALISGSYDAANDLFTIDPATGNIDVHLEVGNFPDPTEFKEIWVDIGFTGDLVNFSALGIGSYAPYDVIDLGPGDEAELRFRIYPNPEYEDIFFSIVTMVPGRPVELDWIRVDTICIPEPMTVGLLGFGGLVLLRKRKRSL